MITELILTRPDGSPLRVVLLHGFNIRDGGDNTIDKLADLIGGAGWTVDKDEADYGFINFWSIFLFNGRARARVIYRITTAIEMADVVIGHSNGANYGTQALDSLPVEFKNTKIVIWISAALNTKTPVPDSAKSMLVLYTPHDFWVKLSSYLPFNPWGRMGARGYLGPSKKVTNIMDATVKWHSNWFKVKHLRATWNYIYHYVKEKLI